MERVMKTRLDRSEEAIERSARSFRPVSATKRRTVERILARARKDRNINIRISGETVAQLKRRAEQEGLPYQTLISSILHRYVSDRLVDQEAVEKSLRLIRSAR
jgi:predicted DNA binding CopG/RHH family protein